MKKAFFYIIMFLAIQWVVGMIVNSLWSMISGKSAMESAMGLIVTTVVSSIITLAVFLLAKWSEVSRHWIRKRPWITLTWCAVAAFGAIIPSLWFQEHMPELPNIAEDSFDMIMKDRLGYLSIGLLAPLAEELVFRGAILRSLLQWTSRPWIAIALSALFFAAAHMNPAQLPHAFLIGLLLGWLYYRTNSIVPGIVMHWVNNSVAYVMYNLMPEMNDGKIIDLFRGDDMMVYMALGFSLMIFLPSLFQLASRMKRN